MGCARRVWTRAEQAAANKRNLGRGGWGVARRSPEPWAGGRLGGSPAEPGTLGGWAEPWAGGRLGGSPAEPGTLGGNIWPKTHNQPGRPFLKQFCVAKSCNILGKPIQCAQQDGGKLIFRSHFGSSNSPLYTPLWILVFGIHRLGPTFGVQEGSSILKCRPRGHWTTSFSVAISAQDLGALLFPCAF
jgi:hypothetical protein